LLAQALREIDCQYVRVASVRLDTTSRAILCNDREAAAEAANYLEALGHRRIGLITGPPRYRSAHERTTGFLTALEARGVTIPPDMIVEGSYTYDSGVTCGEALLARRPRPTAIFAGNDEMAAGVYKAAYRLKISIPEELSVVGWDDSPLATRLCPAMTTVRMPIRDMGRLAAAKLIPAKVPEEADTAIVTRVTLHLIVRDSTQPPSTV
jgi:LacI family transcriptional regulator